MNPRLVGCLGASMLMGGAFAAAALYSGGGILMAILAYVLIGSFSLVFFALWAFQERPERASRSCRGESTAHATVKIRA